jgi:hypothetical protein
MAGDKEGTLYTLTGGTWKVSSTTDTNEITSISCESTTFCLAIDIGGGVTVYNGSAWSKPLLYGSNGSGVDAIACPKANYCLDTVGGLQAYISGGWHSVTGATISAGGAGQWALSCAPGTYFCTVASDTGYATTWIGKWSTPKMIDTTPMATGGNSTSGISSVSCPVEGLCAAVDGYGNVLYETVK